MGKKYALSREDIRPLLQNWNDADSCLATDLITVEGSRVGYCYRERPDNENDSGWRFLGGGESREYLDNKENSGVYPLNIICNYDKDIIPLLRSPYGSAFARDENGVFRPVPGCITRRPPGLLGQEQTDYMQSLCSGGSGYYYKMLSYLEDFVERGIRERRFSTREAREDLGIALWYSYACNNIDEYYFYFKAARWMETSEKNALGCGTWYYRYSCALMYCGRLEEALRYAEEGVRQEPGYPWGWLQLGRLRSHFGDKEGALEAARRGLELEPGDYEFLTLQQEIEAGCSLEDMDKQLRSEPDSEAFGKQLAIAGIVTDESNLAAVKNLLRNPLDWVADSPYCSCSHRAEGCDVQLIFRMNEAALSKLDVRWLGGQLEKLDHGMFPPVRAEDELLYPLQAVLIDQDLTVTLLYEDIPNDTYRKVVVKNDAIAESAFREDSPADGALLS